MIKILILNDRKFPALSCIQLIHGGKRDFPNGLGIKNLPVNAGDSGLITELRRSPGEGSGNPLQYSCLGNPMDRGAWLAAVYGIAKVRHNLATNNNNKIPLYMSIIPNRKATWILRSTVLAIISHCLFRPPSDITYIKLYSLTFHLALLIKREWM